MNDQASDDFKIGSDNWNNGQKAGETVADICAYLVPGGGNIGPIYSATKAGEKIIPVYGCKASFPAMVGINYTSTAGSSMINNRVSNQPIYSISQACIDAVIALEVTGAQTYRINLKFAEESTTKMSQEIRVPAVKAMGGDKTVLENSATSNLVEKSFKEGIKYVVQKNENK